MDNQKYNDFLKKLYDILLEDNIISYNKKPSTSKEKLDRIKTYLDQFNYVKFINKSF